MIKILRRPGTQDISWFLDQHRLGRLDLDPPYQRRSVWTSKDRRYFIDTLFRGYPCPPIYLHKTIDNGGLAKFHVVDGKQRLETLINFAENKIRIPAEYGDERLNNKRWKDILSDTEIRNRFLNYPFVVEYFDDIDSGLVNEVFERMNKNSRKLTPQELRNARYDGWFAKHVEIEVEETLWKDIGIVTAGRSRRMADMQFIAELFIVVINDKISGFDHEAIDNVYAEYEDPTDSHPDFDTDAFKTSVTRARDILTAIHKGLPQENNFLSSVSNTYTIWSILTLLHVNLPDNDILVERYRAFVEEINKLAQASKEARQRNLSNDGNGIEAPEVSEPALEYYNANQSATTEFPQRVARFQALRKALGIEDRQNAT